MTIADSTFSDVPDIDWAVSITGSNFSGSNVSADDTLQITGSSFTGGVIDSEGTLTATKSSFSDMSDFYGGGLTSTNDTFSGNSFMGSGDALTSTNDTFSDINDLFSDGTLTSTNDTFSDLGAVYIDSALSSKDSIFVDTGVYSQGTVDIESDDTLAITTSTFWSGTGPSVFMTVFGGSTAMSASSSFSGSYLNSAGTLTISSKGALTSANSTFAGISMSSKGALTSTNNTFSGTSLNSPGLQLYNTILANGSTCAEEVTGGTNNLIEASGNQACGLSNGFNGNIVGPSAKLGAPTGSPPYFGLTAVPRPLAPETIPFALAPPVNNTSQNGLTRPQGPKCDIGSYEAPPFNPLTEIYFGAVTTLGDIKQAIKQIAAENGYTVSSITCTQGNCGDPINTRTGAFSFSTPDLSIPTSAGNLVFQRTYSSGAVSEFTLPLGNGWTDNQSAHLIFPPIQTACRAIFSSRIRLGTRTCSKSTVMAVIRLDRVCWRRSPLPAQPTW